MWKVPGRHGQCHPRADVLGYRSKQAERAVESKPVSRALCGLGFRSRLQVPGLALPARGLEPVRQINSPELLFIMGLTTVTET